MAFRDREPTEPTPSVLPVSAIAVKRGLVTATGSGKSTDLMVYRRYHSQLELARTSLWEGIKFITHVRTKFIGENNGFVPDAYVGGLTIFYASAAEQAKMNGQRLPRVNFEDSGAVQLLDVQLGSSGGLDGLIDNVKPAYEGTGVEQLPELGDPRLPIEERMDLQDKITGNLDLQAEKLVLGENAASNQAALDALMRAAQQGFGMRITNFTHNEEAFVATMKEHWWDEADPSIVSSQLMGAVDMEGMIINAANRPPKVTK